MKTIDNILDEMGIEIEDAEDYEEGEACEVIDYE